MLFVFHWHFRRERGCLRRARLNNINDQKKGKSGVSWKTSEEESQYAYKMKHSFLVSLDRRKLHLMEKVIVLSYVNK